MKKALIGSSSFIRRPNNSSRNAKKKANGKLSSIVLNIIYIFKFTLNLLKYLNQDIQNYISIILPQSQRIFHFQSLQFMNGALC